MDSRFDIMVAKHFATLVTLGDETEIHAQNGVTLSREDPLRFLLTSKSSIFLKRLMRRIYLCWRCSGVFCLGFRPPSRSPPSLAEQDIAMPDMAVGIYSWALVVDHQQHTAQLVGQSVENAWGWLNQQEAIKPSEETDFVLTSPWRSNMSNTAYQDKFARVRLFTLGRLLPDQPRAAFSGSLHRQ